MTWFYFQALECLLTRPNSVTGQVFYITDGNPISLHDFLDPLHQAVMGINHQPDPILLPAWTIVAVAVAMEAAAAPFGKSVHWPVWAYTTMEAYKVMHYLL